MSTATASHPATVLGFDFGTARIGVAIGQTLTATARPLATVRVRQGQPDWDSVTRLIQVWRPAVLVVGLPRHADDTPSAITTAVLQFSRQLRQRYQLDVVTIDERLSSQEAKGLLSARTVSRRKGKRSGATGVDAVAAMVILESWLNQAVSDSPAISAVTPDSSPW